MSEEINFETYLYISKEEFKIFLLDKKNLINLYQDEIKLKTNFNFIDYEALSKFLDNNIYQIEKLIGEFVKNIFIIIENKENLNIKIGNKKKILKI